MCSPENQKFVYVSTAYSNAKEKLVEEKVYESLQKVDLEWYVKSVEVLLQETVNSIMKQTQVRISAGQLIKSSQN